MQAAHEFQFNFSALNSIIISDYRKNSRVLSSIIDSFDTVASAIKAEEWQENL